MASAIGWPSSRREKHLCELVDGLLVEKTMGFRESCLAAEIARLLGNFVRQADLGMVLGADGMARLAPGLVRIPDVSFIPWDHLPSRTVPNQPMLTLAPALAVEVLSPSNTREEMERKLRACFKAGIRLVWYVDPAGRTVTVHTAVNQSTVLTERHTLDGGHVLPGFGLSVQGLFASLVPRPSPLATSAKGDKPAAKGRREKRGAS